MTTPMQDIITQGAAPVKKKRALIDIVNERPDVLATAKSFGDDPFAAGTKGNTWVNDWWNTAGKGEYSDVELVQPAQPPTQGATVLPGGSQGDNSGGTSGDSGKIDPRDEIIKRLTDALQKSSPTGKSDTENAVGSFEQEILKTNSLLSDLENQVKLGQAKEENRWTYSSIAAKRKEAIAGAVEPTRQDLLKTLGTATTNRGFALNKLGIERQQSQDERQKNLDLLDIMSDKYQTPAEKDAAELKDYEAKLKLQRQYPNKQIVGTAETGYYSYDSATGQKTLVVPPKPETGGDAWSAALGIAAKDSSAFNTAFQEQYEKVLAGTYGTQGAREKAGQAMVVKYPQYANAIWKKIYGDPVSGVTAIFPNGYESQIKSTDTVAEGKRKVIGAIETSKAANESPSKINQRIREAGYQPEEFSEYLQGYAPKDFWGNPIK